MYASMSDRMNRGGQADNTPETGRPKRLDELLTEAELRARGKNGEPDDVTYWDFVADAWRRQQNLAQDAELPKDPHRVSRDTNSHPKGTRYTLRRQGRPGAEELVDLSAAKAKASKERTDKYADYKKCEAYWVNRHAIFVSLLKGRAKDIYSGIFNDDDTLAAYDRRVGWQKTNFVYELIRAELYSPDQRSAMVHRYHSMRQRPGQTNRAYIAALEEKRRELTAMGSNVTPEEFREKILNTLNVENMEKRSYFDTRNKSLQEVKAFLYEVDDHAAALARMKRKHPWSDHGGHPYSGGIPKKANTDASQARSHMVKASEWREFQKLRAERNGVKGDRPPVICWNCNKPGHKSPDCPERKGREARKSGPKGGAHPISAIERTVADLMDFKGADGGDSRTRISSDDEGWSLPSDIDDEDEIELQVLPSKK